MARPRASPGPPIAVPAPAASADQPLAGARSAPKQPIRIGLVDDHHLVREGLRLVLAGDDRFEVVGEAATSRDAFDLVRDARPDVLVLDITLPDGDSLPLLRELSVQHPAVRIVVLTMHSDAETVRQALAAGASGYLVKGAHSVELFTAISAVARGERYLHSSVTGAIVDDSIRWLHTGRMSAREREILVLLASGHPPAEIGRTLAISVHTVRRHIANLSEKLGLRGTNALTRYAIRHGLVRDD
jgi:DNA-binding NarL/FixJ family response regulator